MPPRSAAPKAATAAAATAARSGAGAKRSASAAEDGAASVAVAAAADAAGPAAAAAAAPSSRKRVRKAVGGAAPASDAGADVAAPHPDAEAAAAADPGAAAPAAASDTMREAETGSHEARAAAAAASDSASGAAAGHDNSASSAGAAARASAAGAAAAAGRSPASRIDRDSLSLVLSLLNSTDFLSALQVSRQWHDVAGLQAAWPPLRVEALTQKLRDDDYDNPAQRRLRITAKPRQALTRLAASPIWSKCNDVVLQLPGSTAGGSLRRSTTAAVLQSLASFPHLTSLSLLDAVHSDAAAVAFALLADRVQVLSIHNETTFGIVSCARLVPQLRLLRVLVSNIHIPPEDLLQLKSLQYLHVTGAELPEPTCAAVRELSLRGQLKSFSAHCLTIRSGTVTAGLSQLASPAVAAASLRLASRAINVEAALAALALPHVEGCALQDLALISDAFGRDPHDFECVASIATLVRLEVQLMRPASYEWGAPVAVSAAVHALFSRLRELNFAFSQWGGNCEAAATSLATSLLTSASNLCTLNLRTDVRNRSTWIPATRGEMLAVLLPPAPLEELTLELRLMLSQSAALWSPLAAYARLRRLSLSVRPQLELAHLSPTLGSLRALEAVEVQVYYAGTAPFEPATAPLLAAVASSRSWRSLALHLFVAAHAPVCKAYRDSARMAQFSSDDAAAVTALHLSARVRDFRVTRHAIDERGRPDVQVFAPAEVAPGIVGWKLVQ